MRYGILFLVGDALRRSAQRPLALVLWALAVAAALVSGTVLFLIPTGPGSPGAAVEAYLLAGLSVSLSETAIARLGSEIVTWPGVDGVTFRFPGETSPVPIAERTLLVRLMSRDVREIVEPRLRTLIEVTGVEYHERRSAHVRVPPTSRIAAVGALVGMLALCLWLGHRAVTGAAAAWGKELALLRSCGAGGATLRAPFFALGALVGSAGGGVYVGACWALWTWGRSVSYLRDVVPNFPHVWGGLAAGGIAIGIGLGLIGSLVATLAPPTRS